MNIRREILTAIDGTAGLTVDEIAAKCPEVGRSKVASNIYPMEIDKLVERARDGINRVIFKLTDKGRDRLKAPWREKASQVEKKQARVEARPLVVQKPSKKAAPDLIGAEYHTDGTLIIFNGPAEITLNAKQAHKIILFIAGLRDYAEAVAKGTSVVDA